MKPSCSRPSLSQFSTGPLVGVSMMKESAVKNEESLLGSLCRGLGGEVVLEDSTT